MKTGILARIKLLFSRKKYFPLCNHASPLTKKVSVFGEKVVFSVDSSCPDWCPDCLAKMAIKCAWCGKSILPGDPVTLYTPAQGWKAPEHAVVYQKDPFQVVGCLRMSCADTGSDRAGFWVPPGKVKRFFSPIEKLLQEGGKGVVVEEDITDISKSTPV